MGLLKALQKKGGRFGSEGDGAVVGFSESVKHQKLGMRIGVSGSELESTLEDGREVLVVVGLSFGCEVFEKVEGFGKRG